MLHFLAPVITKCRVRLLCRKGHNNRNNKRISIRQTLHGNNSTQPPIFLASTRACERSWPIRNAS